MRTRLSTAIAAGDLLLPDTGRLLVTRLPAAHAPEFDPARTDIVHGFAPEAEAWRAAGFNATPEPTGRGYAAALVGLPRARPLALGLLRQAAERLAPGGMLVLDGQKTDGVEPVVKALKGAFGSVEALSQGHGKLVWLTVTGTLPDAVAAWPDLAPSEGPAGWMTAPGVFSADAIDPGSALLCDHLPPLSGTVCDLGAGWGVLARAALAASPAITRLDLVEAEAAALACARLNVPDPRATFHWADALQARGSYDAVLMNPPFHAGRAADPALGQAFLRTAARLLKRTGVLALVANRHLPYERVLDDLFAQVETRADAGGFKVIHARHPRSGPRKAA